SATATPAPAPSTGAGKTADAAASHAASEQTPRQANALSSRENLGARLKSVAATRDLRIEQVPDAFAVPADWLPRQALATSKPVADEDEIEAAKAFAAK